MEPKRGSGVKNLVSVKTGEKRIRTDASADAENVDIDAKDKKKKFKQKKFKK